MKKVINRRDAAYSTAKSLISDIDSNIDNMKLYINEANKMEKNQVDPDDLDTKMAFCLWAFSYDLMWLDTNIKDKSLKDDLICLSIVEYSELTGIPINTIEDWIDRMRIGHRLTYERKKSGFITLPIMFYLGYGDYESLKINLLFSFAATIYNTYIPSVTGYWKRAFELYDIN